MYLAMNIPYFVKKMLSPIIRLVAPRSLPAFLGQSSSLQSGECPLSQTNEKKRPSLPCRSCWLPVPPQLPAVGRAAANEGLQGRPDVVVAGQRSRSGDRPVLGVSGAALEGRRPFDP